MSKGFQITSYSSHQFSIVLISKLVGIFNLEVKEKLALRIRHSIVRMLLLTNIALVLLRREIYKIFRYKLLYAIQILENDALLYNVSTDNYSKKKHLFPSIHFCRMNKII